MERVEACGTCRFWQPPDPRPNPDEPHPSGECRRRCPADSPWPLVRAESWCGEWAPRRAPLPQIDELVAAERRRTLAVVEAARTRFAVPLACDWIRGLIEDPTRED